MRLWTIQHYLAYTKMLETSILKASEPHLFCGDYFRFAYDWMSKKMTDSGLLPPPGVQYPVWAWYQWEGIRKRRDMRESGYAMPGERIVQLTIEVNDTDVLFSDFDAFHYVLNYNYLPKDVKDEEEFEKECADSDIKWGDWRNLDIQTESMQKVRAKIERSWNRVFELEREDDNFVYGSNNKKSIQAVFWQLRTEQVVKTEVFTARGVAAHTDGP